MSQGIGNPTITFERIADILSGGRPATPEEGLAMASMLNDELRLELYMDGSVQPRERHVRFAIVEREPTGMGHPGGETKAWTS
jgi:hypothetical protein